ncbi:MAG: glycerophosphodiester phosphodiesterase [Clostridia bacterium]
MTKIIAHRGASLYAPENTLASFQLAIDVGSDGIEMDVHLSKNGVPVVIHDYDVKRTTTETGYVNELTDKELIQLDAGSWFGKKFGDQSIPLLSEVLELCVETNDDFLINIELKSGSTVYPQIEEKVLRIVDNLNLNDKVLISSFDHYAIEKIKNLNEEIKTGALFSSAIVSPWRYLSTLDFDAYHTVWHRIDKEVIDGCHQNGLSINAYTLDDPNFANILITYGIDGIITNDPERLLNLKKELLTHE